MAFSITYKPLFEVNILHQFFLNKGETNFDDLGAIQKKKQMEAYRLSDIFHVQTSHETRTKLAGHHLVFKATERGFCVWVKVAEGDNKKPFIGLEDDLQLTFLLKLVDPLFYNFTDLDFDTADKLFLFSNRKTVTEQNIPFIKKAGSDKLVSEDYALEKRDSSEVWKALQNDEKQQLFGVVSIFVEADNGGLSLLRNNGDLRNNHRQFEINFPNRKTHWRYIFQDEQTVLPDDEIWAETDGESNQIETKAVFPLTSRGYIELEWDEQKLPNPDATLIKPDTKSNKIFSEVYI